MQKERYNAKGEHGFMCSPFTLLFRKDLERVFYAFRLAYPANPTRKAVVYARLYSGLLSSLNTHYSILLFYEEVASLPPLAMLHVYRNHLRCSPCTILFVFIPGSDCVPWIVRYRVFARS